MTQAILVVGQSHVAAIRAAAKLRRETDPDRPRTRVIHLGEARYAPELCQDESAFVEPLAEAILEQVALHAPRIVSCIGGNVHNVLGLIRHPRPFDFRLMEDDEIDPLAEPLPLAIVRTALSRAMTRDMARIRLLVDLVGPVLHLESPPPLLDDKLIAERADDFFRGANLAGRGVAPPALRHRLWRLHSAILRDACASLGVTWLAAPEDVLDAHGFLHPRFAGDATHGNAAYGERMIRMIEDHA